MEKNMIKIHCINKMICRGNGKEPGEGNEGEYDKVYYIHV